jgi:hypothetical protein
VNESSFDMLTFLGYVLLSGVGSLEDGGICLSNLDTLGISSFSAAVWELVPLHPC